MEVGHFYTLIRIPDIFCLFGTLPQVHHLLDKGPTPGKATTTADTGTKGTAQMREAVDRTQELIKHVVHKSVVGGSSIIGMPPTMKGGRQKGRRKKIKIKIKLKSI